MKKAFTLIELLVVIAIIAILAAILFPVFAQAKLAAKKTVDLSNMKQIGTVFLLYGNDNDDQFPLTSFPSRGNSWPLRCQPYIKNWDMFRSPGDLSTRWPAAGTPPPAPDAPQNDPRWGFRWTSYLLSAYMSGGFTDGSGSAGRFSVQSAFNSPANVIYVALARDDVAPRDHFHGFYWGNPSEQSNGFMQNLTWDAAKNETKEIKLGAFTDGSNFTYVDGHAKFGKWSQVWWRDIPNSIYAGSFDPKEHGTSVNKVGLSLVALAVAGAAGAHDIWIEPSVNLVRTGDWVRLSLMLGNHGNAHRDFRLASKVGSGDQNLFVVAPNGKRFDLTSSLVDNGYTPQEGFWSTKFAPDQRGLYLVGSTMDKVMSYAPVRDIKSAKTFFVVADKLDKVAEKNPGFDRVLGHPLEIVPLVNPVTPMGAGSEFKVKVLYKGKPLVGTKVSFIPKGAELKGESDPEHEKLTDAKGTVTITLKEANLYLIVAHQKDATAKGEGYQSIGYSASLCLVVPTFCPCCR